MVASLFNNKRYGVVGYELYCILKRLITLKPHLEPKRCFFFRPHSHTSTKIYNAVKRLFLYPLLLSTTIIFAKKCHWLPAVSITIALHAFDGGYIVTLECILLNQSLLGNLLSDFTPTERTN